MIDPAIEAYVEAHTTRQPEHIARLDEETARRCRSPRCSAGRSSGGCCKTLVFLRKPQLVLEIGTYSGGSALWMVRALPPGGKIVTCEIDRRDGGVRPPPHRGAPARGAHRPARRAGAGDDRGARRPVRHGLHRRRQAGLRRLLRCGAAQARTGRADRRRQHAARRARARARRRGRPRDGGLQRPRRSAIPRSSPSSSRCATA